MAWQDGLNAIPLDWLLDASRPALRALTLRYLLDAPAGDPEYERAARAAHSRGEIGFILDAMQPEGYWEQPGPGYNPKYRSTVWALILLAQLGAHVDFDPRVGHACAYLLENCLTRFGQFSATGPPSGTIDCLQGNLCWALLEMGVQDERLEVAFDWMARTVTSEGLASSEDKRNPLRYYAYKCGPSFACGANDRLACAWGATKVMLAFQRLPAHQRSARIQNAIQVGLDFFLGIDPLSAAYPSWPRGEGKPSSNWWKLGFPLFYITDLLQVIEALAPLGLRAHPRLPALKQWILSKQDNLGRWTLEYEYSGKTWGDYGAKKQPNPWVTLRALRVLKALDTSG